MSSTLFPLFCFIIETASNPYPGLRFVHGFTREIPFTQTGTPQFLWICSRLEESFVSEGYSSWPLEFQ